MRICFVSSDFTPDTPAGQGGGIETYIRLITRGLGERGHDIHLVVPTSKYSRQFEDGRVHVHAIRVPDYGESAVETIRESQLALAFAWHARRKVRALVASGGPFDVVEAPEYKGQGAYLGQDPDIRLVVKCHAHLLFCLALNQIPLSTDTAFVADLERQALGSASRVNANSRFLGERCAADHDIDLSRFDCLPYGIDTRHFQPTASRLRHQLGIGDRPTLLFAGRMEERKGLSLLVDAFADVARSRSDVVLLLAGGDVSGARHHSNANWMCREWERRGVGSDRFLFLGRVPHQRMPAVYSAADILVAPSPLEAFGFVYLEAMACGCPPIGCTSGGAPEVILANDTGVLIPPHDARALVSAIHGLLDDRQRRDRMAARGREHVATHFSLESMVDRTAAFYRSVAA
jgi:glycosyltransferase involved in cell wall biosynthesis